MSALDTFKKRMSATSGNTIRDEIIKNTKQMLNSTFLDDASANLNIVYWKTDTHLKCRITDKKKSATYGVSAKIQVLIDENLGIGDVIYDTKENLYWICVEMYNIGEVNKQGILALSNYTIKFQSPTGTILSYPCITSAKSFNEDSTKVITLPSNQKSILCGKNADTLLLKAGRRLYIDTRNESVFKLLDPDTTSFNYGNKGLLYFIAEQDLEQNNTEHPDNPDLGVCNYVEPTVTPEPPVGNTYATISANDELIIGNSDFITLTPTFYNSDGTVSNINTAVWSYVYPIGYQNEFTIVPNGNNIKIKLAEVFGLLGKKLVCSVSDGIFGGFEGSIELIITSGW